MFVFDKWLDKCASEISQLVIYSSFINIESLKLSVKTILCNSLDREMKRLDDDLSERLHQMLMERQSENVPTWRKREINIEEQKISRERKEVRMVWHQIREKSEYEKLKEYVKQKFGEECLQEFIETLKND